MLNFSGDAEGSTNFYDMLKQKKRKITLPGGFPLFLFCACLQKFCVFVVHIKLINLCILILLGKNTQSGNLIYPVINAILITAKGGGKS